MKPTEETDRAVGLLRDLLGAPDGAVQVTEDEEPAWALLRERGVELRTEPAGWGPEVRVVLVSVPDRIDPLLLRGFLRTRRLGRELVCFDTIDSTNSYLRDRRPPGAAPGLLAVADAQSAGRGRQGRRWLAPPGTGLVWSLLLGPTEDPVGAVCATSVAVAEAVSREAGVSARVKWPNDVVVEGRKIAGILAEHGADGALVVGCGINVGLRAGQLPAELAETATSLALLAPEREPPLRARLLAEILAALEPMLEALLEGRGAEVFERWRETSCTLGHAVRIARGQETLEGTAEALTDEGALVLRLADGSRHVVHSGEITKTL